MDGSTTRWVKNFVESPPTEIHGWTRIFEKVVSLTRERIAQRGIPCRAFDEEDVAVSAVVELCNMKESERIYRLESGNDLWPLLLQIIGWKLSDRVRAELAEKRGAGHIQGSAGLFDHIHNSGSPVDDSLVEHLPPDTDLLVDELLAGLDERTRNVVMYRFQGYEIAEIAQKLNVSYSTAERELMGVRNKWRQEYE